VCDDVPGLRDRREADPLRRGTLLLVGAVAFGVRSCDARHSKGGQTRVERSQGRSGIQQRGRRDRHCGASGEASAASEALTRSNEKDIRNAKGSNQAVDPAARDAGLAACVGGPPIVTTQSAGCSSLIPDSWLQGVAGAPLPEGNTVGDWIVFGDAQTGKLDQANARTKDAIEIQRRCEARDAAAVKKATRGFFGRLFG
jgi:hypothetical protein